MGYSIKEILWGKTETFEVANVEEAVELAERLKREGRYDWFRGQVRDWPPHSSMHRLLVDGDVAKQQRVRRRIGMFFEWAETVPELRYLHDPTHPHDGIAILQHYGIPTYYIDFTTDPGVAGFFAADTNSPPADRQSCIYCLNTGRLEEAWNDLKQINARPGGEMELVTIDVRNLWRLQAQQGTFVYANYNWDVDYPLDKIVFPYTRYPAFPTRELIYPEHKSPLEQLLDQYFSLENATFKHEELSAFIEGLRAKGQNASASSFQLPVWGYHREAFAAGASLAALPSWAPDALQAWHTDPHEQFHETVGARFRLQLEPSSDVQGLRRTVGFGVKQILCSQPGVRQKAIDWVFSGLPDQVSSEQLNTLFRPAWNGLRRLPYSDADIAEALSSILGLALVEFGRATDVETDRRRFAQCFGDSIEVGFDFEDNSSSRGFASRASLASAVGADIGSLLLPDHRHRADDIAQLFTVVHAPSLLFEFEAFKTVFAREIIPAQVLLRRSPILFNPARLRSFGNA